MMLLSYLLLLIIACPLSVPSVYLGLKVWKTKKDVLNRSSAFMLMLIGRQISFAFKVTFKVTLTKSY